MPGFLRDTLTIAAKDLHLYQITDDLDLAMKVIDEAEERQVLSIA